jgi:glycosyltransferase involved in cell wall biosynthesis
MTKCDGLRVLLVGTYPPPFGGIASHLTSLVPGLKARGAEDVAVISFLVDDAVEQRDGFTVYRFNVKKHWWRLLHPSGWGVAWATLGSLARHGLGVKTMLLEAIKAALIEDVARRHRSDVVSAYQADMNIELVPLHRRWERRRAIVLTVFGELYERTSGPYMKGHAALFQELLAAPVAVASSSCHCARSFTAIDVSRPIEAVYYGVRLDNADASASRARFRDANGIGPDEVVVLFMSRFSKEMGLDVLLAAAPALLARPRVRIVLAGAKGDQTVDAEKLAAAYPGRVIVMQDVPFSQQPGIYNGADVLVAPSFDQRACMGMAIKEAMAARLPVVGGAGGGVPEAIVHGETGFLVPLAGSGSVDVDQFVKDVTRLVEDSATRQRLGQAGRARAESLFASDKTNERMAQIFMDARSTVEK